MTFAIRFFRVFLIAAFLLAAMPGLSLAAPCPKAAAAEKVTKQTPPCPSHAKSAAQEEQKEQKNHDCPGLCTCAIGGCQAATMALPADSGLAEPAHPPLRQADAAQHLSGITPENSLPPPRA